MSASSRPSILVTGASGGFASIILDLLSENYEVVGADPRPLPAHRKFSGEFYQVEYTNRRMVEVFRNHQFEALIHLGRIPVNGRTQLRERYNTNVLGTQALLNLAVKHSVQNVVVMSTYHVYGAQSQNHLNLIESEPLRASQTFPELVDAVEMDHISRMFLLQNPDIRTVVLRPVNVIGARIQNAITRLLRSKHCPVLVGYDPLLQFIHESDLARVVLMALKASRSGVYNVGGEGAVSYRRAIELAGSSPLPLPHFLVYPALHALSRFSLSIPEHLVDYFRYPTVVSDRALRSEFGFRPEVTTLQALRSLS